MPDDLRSSDLSLPEVVPSSNFTSYELATALMTSPRRPACSPFCTSAYSPTFGLFAYTGQRIAARRSAALACNPTAAASICSSSMMRRPATWASKKITWIMLLTCSTPAASRSLRSAPSSIARDAAAYNSATLRGNAPRASNSEITMLSICARNKGGNVCSGGETVTRRGCAQVLVLYTSGLLVTESSSRRAVDAISRHSVSPRSFPTRCSITLCCCISLSG